MQTNRSIIMMSAAGACECSGTLPAIRRPGIRTVRRPRMTRTARRPGVARAAAAETVPSVPVPELVHGFRPGLMAISAIAPIVMSVGAEDAVAVIIAAVIVGDRAAAIVIVAVAMPVPRRHTGRQKHR